MSLQITRSSNYFHTIASRIHLQLQIYIYNYNYNYKQYNSNYYNIQLQMQAQNQPLSYIDSHTHLLDYPSEHDLNQIIANSIKNNVKFIVVNTTTTAQFPKLLQLCEKYSNIIVPAFGVHPYYISAQQQIQKNKQEPRISWIQQLQEVIKKQQKYSIGQIGLDFRKDVLQKNPKDLQMHYFKKQLQMAISLNKPATIHCVRAHGQMLKIFKDLNKNIKQQAKPHFIMHSYGGSLDITQSMLKLTNISIYFSLCLKRSPQLTSVIPIDKLIFQTDSPCQNNIQLLEEQNRAQFNPYFFKIKEKINKQNLTIVQQSQHIKLQKLDTNEPANVVTNVKSLIKYYKMDESKFTKIIYENSLKAFKLLK